MLTQTELNKKLRFWKGILGLKRWKIRIQHGDPHPNAWAEVDFMRYKRSANIVISTDKAAVKYIDWMILHELAHIVFARKQLNVVKDSKPFHDFEEYVCDTIASSLCRAYELPVFKESADAQL
jgi:hypothetical protein